jgi:hypothetical protein
MLFFAQKFLLKIKNNYHLGGQPRKYGLEQGLPVQLQCFTQLKIFFKWIKVFDRFLQTSVDDAYGVGKETSPLRPS